MPRALDLLSGNCKKKKKKQKENKNPLVETTTKENNFLIYNRERKVDENFTRVLLEEITVDQLSIVILQMPRFMCQGVLDSSSYSHRSLITWFN